MKLLLSLMLSAISTAMFAQTSVGFESLKRASVTSIKYQSENQELFITDVPVAIRELKFKDVLNLTGLTTLSAIPTATPGTFKLSPQFYEEVNNNLVSSSIDSSVYQTTTEPIVKIKFVFGRESAAFESEKLSGSMIKDALTLASLKGDAKADFCVFLKGFYDIPLNTTRKNPFFWDCPTAGTPLAVATSGGAANPVSSFLSSIGGLDVTNIADGLARFFVKRTKQELNAAFFDKLKTILDDDRYRDLRLIFPQTHLTLQALGDEIYNYEAYLSTLRESFKQDLDLLPPHLQSWLYEGTLSGYLSNHKGVRAGAFSSLYIYGQLSNDAHPGQLIADFPTDSLSKIYIPIDKERLIVEGSVKTFAEISKSLWSGDKDDKYWVDSETLRAFLKNKEAQKYYMAMLYEKVKNIKVKISAEPDTATTTMGTILTGWADPKNFEPKIQQLKSFVQESEQLEKKLKLVQESSIPDSVRLERYSSFFDQFTATVRSGYKLTQNWLAIPESINPKFERILTVSDQVAKLGINVSRKKYGAAVIQAAGVFKYLTAKTPTDTLITIASKNITREKKITLNWDKKETDVKKQGEMLASQLKLQGISFEFDATNSKLTFHLPNDNKQFEINVKADMSATFSDVKAQLRGFQSDPEENLVSFRLPIFYRKREIKSAQVNLSKNSQEVVSELIRYGSMMAAVSEAKNSQEVADAIEAFALPAGSSSIKRKSEFNIALNGYTGLLAGHQTKYQSPYINSYAVWAPIGITVSRGKLFRRANPGNHSLSLFASFIDIGAITAFRFSDDTTVTLKKIELKDILAPGAAISWGIAKTPLALSFGWQASPFLQNVTSTANTTVDYRANRWYLTLAVDLPLLNFYNRKNRR